MPVTAWEVDHENERWGVREHIIIPAALAQAVAEHEGQEFVTYYGKPYTVRADDPQSVWDYFATEIDPHADRVALLWEYAPDPEYGDAIP